MKRIILVPTALCLLTIISILPVVAARHSTPLNGSMTGSGIATSQATNSITATIHLNHLGESSLVGTTTVTGTSDCNGFVGHEEDTITSANGDQLFVSGQGKSCPVSTNPLVFQDTVTFTINGGTGRFAHASGSGTTQTTITITSPDGASTFTATITGSISY